MLLVVLLFSSRRRHTRFDCDWSSDVCSSDLRPADEDPSVTVSPVPSDPVVRYDGIWVAGLHAEAFPQPPQPDPFLPLGAQVASGVPSASATHRLAQARAQDRKSTRLNSSHSQISYAVFCLEKKKTS